MGVKNVTNQRTNGPTDGRTDKVFLGVGTAKRCFIAKVYSAPHIFLDIGDIKNICQQTALHIFLSVGNVTPAKLQKSIRNGGRAKLGKLHLRNDSVYLGISLGVGALNSCPNGLGHLFREELR